MNLPEFKKKFERIHFDSQKHDFNIGQKMLIVQFHNMEKMLIMLFSQYFFWSMK